MIKRNLDWASGSILRFLSFDSSVYHTNHKTLSPLYKGSCVQQLCVVLWMKRYDNRFDEAALIKSFQVESPRAGIFVPIILCSIRGIQQSRARIGFNEELLGCLSTLWNKEKCIHSSRPRISETDGAPTNELKKLNQKVGAHPWHPLDPSMDSSRSRSTEGIMPPSPCKWGIELWSLEFWVDIILFDYQGNCLPWHSHPSPSLEKKTSHHPSDQ